MMSDAERAERLQELAASYAPPIKRSSLASRREEIYQCDAQLLETLRVACLLPEGYGAGSG